MTKRENAISVPLICGSISATNSDWVLTMGLPLETCKDESVENSNSLPNRGKYMAGETIKFR